MGIIQLEGNLLIEFTDIIMGTHILLNCFLYGCGNKEVLLFQTKLFTCIMIVIRIQDFHNISCKVFLFYSLAVITFIKRIELEALYRLCIPDTKCIYNTIAITYNRQIIRYSSY